MAFYDVTKCLGIRQHDFAYLKSSWLLMEKNIAARIEYRTGQESRSPDTGRCRREAGDRYGLLVENGAWHHHAQYPDAGQNRR